MNIYLRTISIINSKLLPIFPYGPLAAEIILESESIFLFSVVIHILCQYSISLHLTTFIAQKN